MTSLIPDDQLLKKIFTTSKTIAMVGVSSLKKEENPSFIKRRPSTIVMKYLQEFGYKVIPVNPTSEGKQLFGETIVGSLKDITVPVDIVNVFRPSTETPEIAKLATEIETRVFWLQYGIQNMEAENISNSANIIYVANRCIKQEYQRLFLKMNPVFPALKN